MSRNTEMCFQHGNIKSRIVKNLNHIGRFKQIFEVRCFLAPLSNANYAYSLVIIANLD